MMELLDSKIVINLRPLIWWSLMVLAIAIVNLIRGLFLKQRLSALLEQQDPELFKQISTSNANFAKFIAATDDTGNEVVDLLKFKARRSRQIFAGLALYVLFLLLHVGVFYVAMNE